MTLAMRRVQKIPSMAQGQQLAPMKMTSVKLSRMADMERLGSTETASTNATRNT